MDHIERQILSKLNITCQWKRYIDDVFIIWPDRLVPNEILTTANSVNKHIQFTLEKQANGRLPFLDCEIMLTSGKFHSRLFFKELHSGAIHPWNSHTPVSLKRGIVIGEFNRAVRCSTDDEHVKYSVDMVIKRFQNNGYPRNFLQRTYQRFKRNPINDDDNRSSNRIFIKCPFISEEHKRRMLSSVRKSGLHDMIRLGFSSAPPLKRVFHPPKDRLSCSPNCKTCKISIHPNTCNTKSVIYKISCGLCSKIYIGQTARTVGTRISEHINCKNLDSAVCDHFHVEHPHSQVNIQWEIIHSNVHNYSRRIFLESLYINEIQPDQLMNGCTGKKLTIVS